MNANYPDWVAQNQVDEVEVVVDDLMWVCPVLRPEIGQGFEDFAGFLKDIKLPFVSAAVPSLYRRAVLIHEILEFTELADHEHRCREALTRELQAVALDGFMEYVQWRLGNFRRLQAFVRAHPDGYPSDFAVKLQVNIDYLLNLTA